MEIFKAFGTLVLNGAESVNRGLDKIDARAGQAGQALEDMGERVSSVGDTLSKFSAGLSAAGGAAGFFLSQLGGVGRQVQQQAAQLGIGTQETQEFQAVMRRAGLQAEDTSDALISLRDRAEDAAAGAQGAKDDFALLGITASELEGLNLPQTFNLVADAVKNAENETQAAVAAQRLFGDEIGRQLIPVLRQGSEGINRLRDDATTLSKEFIDGSTTFSRGLDRVGQDFVKLGAIVAREVFPIFNDTLIPLWENKLFPALASAARWIGDLIEAFRELPAWVQRTAATFLLVATALGPVLSIGGRLLSLFGRFLPLVAGFNPILLAVTVAIAAVVAALTNWESITRTVGQTWTWLKEQVAGVADWIEARVQTFQQNWIQPWVSLVERTIALMGRLRDQVKSIVGDLFDATIGRIERLANEIVGNSIVPDMVDGLGREFKRMADTAGAESDRMARDVMKAVDGVDPTINMGVRGGRAGRGQGAAGGGQNVNVDLRGSIIRDGRDMSDRLIRNGVGLTGAF